MPQEFLDLPPAERLRALRQLDEFHPWESVAEERLCRRCGQFITGEEIKIFGDRSSHEPVRLECPTEGCASVPLEWIMLESAEQRNVPPIAPKQEGTVLLAQGVRPSRRGGFFAFLRAPRVFF